MFQLRLLLTSLQFYTRIPVPSTLPYSDDLLNRSTRYFPFIGWVTGGLGALVWWGGSLLFPENLSLLVSMAFVILLTGAFHEDGFADFCDGLGGGYTREKRLSIMKDSRIGTYGSTGMMLMLALRFAALAALPVAVLPAAMINSQTLSRLMPVGVIFTTGYARVDETSKIKPIGKRGRTSDLVIATLIALLPLLLLPLVAALVCFPLVVLTTRIFRKYLQSRLGGYTGDCLGALQQICELLILLILVAFYRLTL